MSEHDLPGGASWTDMIQLRWTGVHVPRHLYAMVMVQMETLEDRYPDVLAEFVQLVRDPGHEPPLEARKTLARLRIAAAGQTRAIVLNSEYGRGVTAPRAAQIMTGRLGVEVTADGVAELWRRGLIPITGAYRDEPLFDRIAAGRADAGLAEDATWAGRMLGPDEAAAYLQISRAAFDWLFHMGYIHPCDRIWDPRISPGMDGFLYIVCDLDRAARAPGINWQALRSAPESRWDVAVAKPEEAPPGTPWFWPPCSPHCRCRLRHESVTPSRRG